MKQIMRWPAWVSLLILLLDLSVVLAVWASLGDFAAWMAFFLTIALSFALYIFSSLQISVTSNELTVGPARIELQFLGKVETLDEKQMKYLRGPGINPNAYMALRFWVKEGVRIEIIDPRDPTPYWLVSSKDPQTLAQNLTDPKQNN
jgi:hypothetical protein